MAPRRSFLFVHQNMPGQFVHLARHLRAQGHEIVFITKSKENSMANVTKVLYEPQQRASGTHPYLHLTENAVLHGQAVVRAIHTLKKQGFKHDVVVGHFGWGETLFIKDVLPNTPLLNYFEWFYDPYGKDMGFDPEYPRTLDNTLNVKVRNSINLLALNSCDRGLTPTHWQLASYPEQYRSKISVIHDGIDTRSIAPDPEALLILPNGRELRPGDKVVTFVARNLEPYRGFHIFMRALPEIQRRHPDTEILVIGGDGVSYGRNLPGGETYKNKMLKEVDIDKSRVHFMGTLGTEAFHAALHVSAAHVYLTFPFVLSWSMLEAMACGCLVIGSRTPPVEEVIAHGKNGILVDFFDIDALTSAVSDALEKPETYKQIRVNARNTISARYDVASTSLPQQSALLEDLILGRA